MVNVEENSACMIAIFISNKNKVNTAVVLVKKKKKKILARNNIALVNGRPGRLLTLVL